MHDYLDPWGLRRRETDPTVKVRQMYAGQPTDDSELTAILASSIVGSKGLDEEDTYRCLRDFIHGNTPEGRKSFLTRDTAYGSGGTLRKALKPATYAESDAGFRAGEIPLLPTNGSLMRNISVPLFGFREMGSMLELARRQSMLTHRHPLAVAACQAHAVMVAYILYGLPPRRAWETACKVLSTSLYTSHALPASILSISTDLPSEMEMQEAKGNDKESSRYGDVVLTLRIAVAASIAAKDFRDGVEKAIAVGGDTDTYAAVAGGILGAHFGMEGIPNEWSGCLIGGGLMLTLADELFELAHPELVS